MTFMVFNHSNQQLYFIENEDTLLQEKNGIANLKKTINSIITDKYFEAFNFYFSKPTNEMIVNIETPHVILFKDYLYFDDINEFLKRPYNTEESKAKMEQLINFYQQQKDLCIATLCTVQPGRIMNKRASNLEYYHEKNQQQLNRNESRIDKKQVQEEVSISNRVLTSHFQDQLYDSKLPDQYSGQFENQMMESYETNAYDIYNPNSSGYSSFDDQIDTYAKKFETNSPLSSKFDFELGLSTFSMQSSQNKSELLMFQEFITRTDEKITNFNSPQKGNKIALPQNIKFKKPKKSPRKKRKEDSQQSQKNNDSTKRRKFKAKIKQTQSTTNIISKRKKLPIKKNKIKTQMIMGPDIKQKLENYKKIEIQHKNQRKRKGSAKKKRSSSRKLIEKKRQSWLDNEIQNIANQLKSMSGSKTKDSNNSDRFIYKLIRQESERLNTQGKIPKAKKVVSKKRESQRYIPTPLPQSARVKKAKTIQRHKKKQHKKSKNQSGSKKKSIRINKQKQPSRQGQYVSMTHREMNSPKDMIKVLHDQSLKYNNFLKKNQTNSKNHKKSKNYDFKLNLNNLRMKIQDPKNPMNYQELAKKAGFWSSRSSKSYQYNKKKKNESKQPKPKLKHKLQSKYYRKKYEANKKHSKTSRSRKTKSKPRKKLLSQNPLSQSQPSLVLLKKKSKGKRKQSHGEIKQQRNKTKLKRPSSSKCYNESTSLNNIQFQKYKSPRLRASEENIQKTRQLIAKFKEKIKQKEIKNVYYFQKQ